MIWLIICGGIIALLCIYGTAEAAFGEVTPLTFILALGMWATLIGLFVGFIHGLNQLH